MTAQAPLTPTKTVDMRDEKTILEVNNLKMHFPITKGISTRIRGWRESRG